MARNRYHSIIVGGGMAGLTCATYLAKAGRQVLLIEKNRECGGLVNTFSHNGFRFDAGIRALENAGIIIPMLNELGISLEFVKSPVSVGVENDILNIDDIGSLEDYSNHLKRLFPGSEPEVDETVRVIRKVMKHMDVLYGIENPYFKDMNRDWRYLFRELLPWFPRFLFTIGKINRMNVPVEPFLDTFIKNRSLRDIISQHFFRNTPAFFALSYFSLYLDYFYPKGGVGVLAESLERKYLESGGDIARETTIVKVSAAESKLTDHNDKEYFYKNLVWAADLKTFYRVTDTGGLSEGLKIRHRKAKEQMLDKRGGDSVFTLFAEVDEPVETFRKIARGHFFYSPSRKGLGDIHWGELTELLKKPGGPEKGAVLEWLDRFLELNTYEISIPALKDPDMAPAGKTGIIISLLADYDLFKLVADSGWYDELIALMEKKIIRIIASSVYPALNDKVTAYFSFSPMSYSKRVGTSEGAITGWSFRDPIPAVNRIMAANSAVTTPLPSVFQAGQWTYSPAGVPMSVLTGKLAALSILKRKDSKK